MKNFGFVLASVCSNVYAWPDSDVATGGAAPHFEDLEGEDPLGLEVAKTHERPGAVALSLPDRHVLAGVAGHVFTLRLQLERVVAGFVRDEIRQIGPGLYLGKVYWEKKRLIDFALQFE